MNKYLKLLSHKVMTNHQPQNNLLLENQNPKVQQKKILGNVLWGTFNFNYLYCFNLFFISDAEQEARNIIEECAADYEASGYSPVYVSPNSLEPGTLVVSELDDNKRLKFARLQVQGTGTRVEVRAYCV